MTQNLHETTPRHPESHIPRELWRELRNLLLPIYLVRTNQELKPGRTHARRSIHREAGATALEMVTNPALHIPEHKITPKIRELGQAVKDADALEALRGKLRALYSRWHFETQNCIPYHDNNLPLYNGQSSRNEVISFATEGKFAQFVQKENPTLWQELQMHKEALPSLR